MDGLLPMPAPLHPAAQEHEGELTVVATGPLTNVALACKMDAQFPHRGALPACLPSHRSCPCLC